LTILFTSTAPVKPARKFGRGILPPPRAETFEPSAEDRRWAAEHLGEPDYDALAAEAAALDRYERGYVC
jgi:hypothetical protein